MMREADQVFWDRIAGMPHVEALQELTSRRAELVEELGPRPGGDQPLAAALTRVNAEIKRINILVTRVQWRAAVHAIFGEDGARRCAEWIAQQDPLA